MRFPPHLQHLGAEFSTFLPFILCLNDITRKENHAPCGRHPIERSRRFALSRAELIQAVSNNKRFDDDIAPPVFWHGFADQAIDFDVQ